MYGSTGLHEPPELLAGYVGDLLLVALVVLRDQVRISAPCTGA